MSRTSHSTAKTNAWNFFWGEYKKLLITALPMALAFVITLVAGYFWNGPLPPSLLSLIFFVGGFTGFIIMVRREIPAVLFTITGVPATVVGGLVTIFLWGAAAYIFLQGI
ncbi:MAG TPA: hypothetical protein VLX61_05710 [Anaerolineales bacterium]|nr:hypothetical protein [Anaerolineales bacterium]